MKIWVTTDTHFNHEAMVTKFGRPKNYQEQILKYWKSMVADDDLVIHLGDVIFSRASELKEIMDSLPGRKVLVRGNHDKRQLWYMTRGFDFACKTFSMNGTAFSHEPLFELPKGCERVIHGHLHDNNHRTDEYPEPIPDFNILVALEFTGYKPVLLEHLTKENQS